MSDRQLREHHDRIVAGRRAARLEQMRQAQDEANERNRVREERRKAAKEAAR